MEICLSVAFRFCIFLNKNEANALENPNAMIWEVGSTIVLAKNPTTRYYNSNQPKVLLPIKRNKIISCQLRVHVTITFFNSTKCISVNLQYWSKIGKKFHSSALRLAFYAFSLIIPILYSVQLVHGWNQCRRHPLSQTLGFIHLFLHECDPSSNTT